MRWADIHGAALVALIAAATALPAQADIYSRTEADGSIALSNVPTDRQYALLVAEGSEARGAGMGPYSSRGKDRPDQALKAQYEPMVEQTARSLGLDSALLHAVISVESRYDAKAVSRKGAAGLMQLMPATAKRYDVADPLNPEQNLRGGARYLRDLLQLFNSDLSLALAAYNAGESAVLRNGNRIPAFKETLDYVPRVLGYYSKYLAASISATQ